MTTFATARLPAVALSVASAVVLAITAPSPWSVPARLLLGPVVVAACAIDLREHRLPDRIVRPATLAALALIAAASLLAGEPHRLLTAVLGALVFSGVLFVLHLVSPSGMGFGDVKFGLLLGLYLGEVSVGLAVWGLLLGSLMGVALALPVAVARRSLVVGIPFGPALAAGTVLALTLAGPLVG